MNTNALLPLTAAALFALCAGSMVLSHHAHPRVAAAPVDTSSAAVDLPTVSVRPDPADLAYFQATQRARIVNLPAVKVTPDLTDLAYYQAAQGAERIVTLAAVSVRPAAADLAWYLSNQAGQLAAASSSALRASATQIDAQVASGAASMVRDVAAR